MEVKNKSSNRQFNYKSKNYVLFNIGSRMKYKNIILLMILLKTYSGKLIKISQPCRFNKV